jgi:enamine deaminase RidA (YjgF/YER057c/UK114 family)
MSISGPELKLRELGIVLPSISPPAGNYVSVIRTGHLVLTSGRAAPAIDGVVPKGKLGREYTSDEGYQFARLACLDLLAAVQKELGSLNQIVRFVELHGALNTTEDFTDHAHVLDGASDLLVEIFGEAGMHVRSVVGVHSLRNGVPLTVKATLEVS